MKEEVKNLWVAALRGGKFEQGRKALNLDGRFCCLGVLCEVLGVPKKLTKNDFTEFEYGDDADGFHHGLLPRVAQTLSGIKTQTGQFTSPDFDGGPGQWLQSLVALNDSGKSFPAIADAIEAHWQQL